MTEDATVQALREGITEIRLGIKSIQATQTLIVERLTRLEERHDNQKAATERAFALLSDHGHRIQKLELEGPDTRETLKRLEVHELVVQRIDGDHKKYLHMGLGVAAVVTLLWGAGSAYVVNEIRKAGDALDTIPQMMVKQKRQDAITRVLLKKLGIEIDLVE